MATVELG